MTAERINDSEGEKDGWRQKETIGEDILNMEKKAKKKKKRSKGNKNIKKESKSNTEVISQQWISLSDLSL